MIRVAHLIQSADTTGGGTTTAFFNILSAVGRLGGELEVTAYFQRPREGDPAWGTINAAPERFRLAHQSGKRLISGDLGHLVARDLAAGKIDVLHVHGLWSPDLVAATRGARRAGVPYVWQSHGMFIRWAWNYKRFKKRLFLLLGLQKCLNAAHSFILMTQDELESSVYPRTITPDKRHVIPLPVEIASDVSRRPVLAAEGRARFALPEGAAVLAFMGRLHPIKRLDMTIAAFAQAAGERPDLRLLLLGKGETDEYEQQLRAQAQSLGVGDRVVFAGWVLGEDKLRGLSAARALVLNSVGESFGYVLFEAIGAGTPVLITENLSLARDFRAAGAATIAPDSIAGLAQGMLQVAADPDATGTVERARSWAAREFSHEAVGRKLLALYHAAMGSGR